MKKTLMLLILLTVLCQGAYGQDSSKSAISSTTGQADSGEYEDWDSLLDKKPSQPPPKLTPEQEQKRREGWRKDAEMFEPEPPAPGTQIDYGEDADWDMLTNQKPAKPAPKLTPEQEKERQKQRQKDAEMFDDWMFEPEPQPSSNAGVQTDNGEYTDWDMLTDQKPAKPVPKLTPEQEKERQKQRQKDAELFEDWMFEPEPQPSSNAGVQTDNGEYEDWDSLLDKKPSNPAPKLTPEQEKERQKQRQKDAELFEDWMFEPEPQPSSAGASSTTTGVEIGSDAYEDWDSLSDNTASTPTPKSKEQQAADQKRYERQNQDIGWSMLTGKDSTPVNIKPDPALGTQTSKDGTAPKFVGASVDERKGQQVTSKSRIIRLACDTTDIKYKDKMFRKISDPGNVHVILRLENGTHEYYKGQEAVAVLVRFGLFRYTEPVGYVSTSYYGNVVDDSASAQADSSGDSDTPSWRDDMETIPMSEEDAQVYGEGVMGESDSSQKSDTPSWRKRGRSYPMSQEDVQTYLGGMKAGASSREHDTPMSDKDAAVYGTGELGGEKK